MPLNLSRPVVKKLFAALSKEYGVRFVESKWYNGPLRAILSRVPNQYAQLVTPIVDAMLRPKALKNIIILDFSIGDESKRSLLNQVEVAVEEVKHSLQIREHCEMGGTVLHWYGCYFNAFDDSFRASMEARAKLAAAEVAWACGGPRPSAPNLMDAYTVGIGGQTLADAIFSMAKKTHSLGRGATTSRLSRFAVTKLKALQ